MSRSAPQTRSTPARSTLDRGPIEAGRLQIRQFPCLNDNYGFLIHDPISGETAAIDTPDADRYRVELEAAGWKLTQIWNTHWHPDHAGGNMTLKAATGARISGPAGEADRIQGLDRVLVEGDTVSLGAVQAEVIDVPGHTSGHIAFYLPAISTAFVGDTLFALGCGRLFEGTPDQMWASLSKLKALPEDTHVFCAHEYTAANARFALTIEPANPHLLAYAEEVTARRAAGEPTVPTTIGRERAANPFLRADQPGLQAAMGHPGDAIATFAEIRGRKDRF
jgi:hydroxyacylglutathione hydrolase